MALILSLETATEHCSVAVARDGVLLAAQEALGVFDHAAQLTSLIGACLQAAELTPQDLEAVAVSNGPGSYTSLRVGLSTAKGLCYALGARLIALDTLTVLARAARAEPEFPAGAWVVAMIDARRMEVYLAVYDQQGTLVRGPEAVVLTETACDAYLNQDHLLVLVGNGAGKVANVLQHPQLRYSTVKLEARHLVALAEAAFQAGEFADLAYTEPFYLKPPNITTPRNVLGAN